MALFGAKRTPSAPLLIIRKESDDTTVREFSSIEEALADLEQDPSVSKEKIEKIRASLRNLKNKTTIRIKNGELLR